MTRWTGPLPEDLMPDGSTLRHLVPPERWPFGPPEDHESACALADVGFFCDCKASAEDDEDFGVSP